MLLEAFCGIQRPLCYVLFVEKNVFLLAGDGAGGPIYGKEMGLRPRAKRNRGPTEVKKRGVGQLK